MKKDIHPKYYNNAAITCSCKAVFKIGSTQEKMEIEICSQCHPFYTGKKKVLDITGRVDRFKKLTEKAATKKNAAKKAKKPARNASPAKNAVSTAGWQRVADKVKKVTAKKKEKKKDKK